MSILKYNYIIAILLFTNCDPVGQKSLAFNDLDSIRIAGAMKNVMWKGELQGVIHLDTIQNKKGLYGLGPVEYLRGELLILNGETFISSVVSDSLMEVVRAPKVKAPFFVYSNVQEWNEERLPAHVSSIKELEEHLGKITENLDRPFVFKLNGKVKNAQIHIQNLPLGSVVSSPDEAHVGQVNYSLKNKEVEIVGFFSMNHKGVFTHHDSNTHMHLITKDRTGMGHLDQISFTNSEMKLYLPLK